MGLRWLRAAKEVEVHVINPRMKTFPFILTVSSVSFFGPAQSLYGLEPL